jgi:hypothetical protein
MSEFVTKSTAEKQQEQKIESRTAVKRIAGFTIIMIATTVLAVLGAFTHKAKTTTSTR